MIVERANDVITGVFALDEEIANMWALRALHRDTVFGVPPAPFLVAKWSRPHRRGTAMDDKRHKPPLTNAA
jgi:hypothetical protein